MRWRRFLDPDRSDNWFVLAMLCLGVAMMIGGRAVDRVVADATDRSVYVLAVALLLGLLSLICFVSGVRAA